MDFKIPFLRTQTFQAFPDSQGSRGGAAQAGPGPSLPGSVGFCGITAPTSGSFQPHSPAGSLEFCLLEFCTLEFCTLEFGAPPACFTLPRVHGDAAQSRNPISPHPDFARCSPKRLFCATLQPKRCPNLLSKT